MLERAARDGSGGGGGGGAVRAMVVTPTRELASQVRDGVRAVLRGGVERAVRGRGEREGAGGRDS